MTMRPRTLEAFVATAALGAALAAVATSAVARVSISGGATANMSCSAALCVATAGEAVLNVRELQDRLASSSVRVATGGSADDIALEAPLAWPGSGVLTLDARRAIGIEARLAVGPVAGLTLVTNDGGSGGALSFGPNGAVTFAGLGARLTINGSAYRLANTVAALAAAIGVDAAGHHALANSYDAGADGVYPAPPVITTFAGTLEGLGNTLSNLSIDDAVVGDQVGLIQRNTPSSVVQNLRLTGVDVKAARNAIVGALIASNFGLLRGDSADGVLVQAGTANHAPKASVLGGLVGANDGAITGCLTSGMVTGKGRSVWVGGLAGLNNGVIRDSRSTAATQAGKNSLVAGLVAENSGSISDSYATGPVTGGGGAKAGGLVGRAAQTAAITNAYATGAVTNPGGGPTGGLVADNAGAIQSAYAAGAVSGGAPRGGLIGLGHPDASHAVADAYWDTGATPGPGVGGPADDPGVTGLTTSQLRSGLPPGFDPTIWGQNASLNSGLPNLLAAPPS